MKFILLALSCMLTLTTMAQKQLVPDSVLQKHSNMLCNCFTKTYDATKTKEQKLKVVGKCYEDVTELYMLSTEAAVIKEIVEKDGDEAKALNKALVKLLQANCTTFNMIVNEKEAPLNEPLAKANEKYFLDKVKMTAKQMNLKINDGQMRTWTAKNMKNSTIQMVYDIRYEFNNETDAIRYYEAKLEFLSEKAPEVANEIKALGVSESNVYSDNSGAAFGLDMKMKNYIFRIKNVVGKVFVSASSKATDAAIVQFAKDAITRIKAAK